MRPSAGKHEYAPMFLAEVRAVAANSRVLSNFVCLYQYFPRRVDSDSASKLCWPAIDFFKHDHEWSNRLIAGDSLLVMNSLLEKEGMAGQVQMIYIDPPYGIDYLSNFQPFTSNRTVKERDEDLSHEPETIKAFRDTWTLGLHSYLAYLRDRIKLAAELLHATGSIFIRRSAAAHRCIGSRRLSVDV